MIRKITPKLLGARGVEERCGLQVRIDGSESDESSHEDDGLRELRLWPIHGLIELPVVQFVREIHDLIARLDGARISLAAMQTRFRRGRGLSLVVGDSGV